MVTEWLKILHAPEDYVEVRSVSPKPSLSGYFRADSEELEQWLARYPDRTFYQTMNQLKEGSEARDQLNKIVQNPKNTTSDNDIEMLKWILLDFDPVRPAGVSSTDAEKLEAHEIMQKVYNFLKSKGFKHPVVADSGNGYHLLYKINLEAQHCGIVEQFLKTMDTLFSTETVGVDTAVFNPSRITKLYGTAAHKGANTPKRPHRDSRILYPLNGEPIEINGGNLVKSITQEYGQQEQQSTTIQQPSYGDSFSLERFIQQHGIRVHNTIRAKDYTKYVLDECPFNAEHKAPDSAIFQFNNGKLGFKCLHNSCSGKGWHEFREFYEPEFYSESRYTTANYTASDFKKLHTSDPEEKKQPKPMLAIEDIEEYDRSKIVVIRSGFGSLDNLIGGFNKGELSVWSGGNGAGKSSLISQLALSAVNQGRKVAIFSGELRSNRVKDWLYMQAAGPEGVEKDPCSKLHTRLKEGIKEQLEKKMAGNVAVYNNEYGTEWATVKESICQWVTEHNADVLVIDNLMALSLAGEESMNAMQSVIVKELSAIAKKMDVHVHFVCHPKKSISFLRKNDISGTADLTNVADNVFMVHRIGADFRNKVREAYPTIKYDDRCTNAVEIMKNRDLGVCDQFVWLYYRDDCRTFTDISGGMPTIEFLSYDDLAF